MSKKDSWERAFGAMDTSEWTNTPEGYSSLDTELEEMRLRQRQIKQDDWNKDLARAKSVADAQTDDDTFYDKSGSWAEAYKDTTNNIEETVETVPLSPMEHIIQALEKDGLFQKEHGAVGSVKLLIERHKILEQQLKSIKASFGQM